MKRERRAIFSLALRLGKTVGQLLEEMSFNEFCEWTYFFDDVAKQQDPNRPKEIDWERMTPQQVGAMFSGK